MKRQQLTTVFLPLLLLLGEMAPSLHAEEKPVPGANLFHTSFKDIPLDLYAAGSWKFRFLGGLGFTVTPEKVHFPSSVPLSSLINGFLFKQIPDIRLFLKIERRLLAEMHFSESLEKSVYLLRYQGRPRELLQSVSLGNSEITIGSYAGLLIPKPHFTALGLSFHFQTAKTIHEALIRYDPIKKIRKVYLGQNEVVEERISPAAYLEGRFFLLPDGDVDLNEVTVYIEDARGSLKGSDERFYRRLPPSEIVLGSHEGTLSLSAESKGRVLVYYDRIGSLSPQPTIPVPDAAGRPSSQRSLNFFAWDNPNPWDTKKRSFRETHLVSIEGREALLLFQPGYFSLFSRFNVYAPSLSFSEEEWRTSVKITGQESAHRKTLSLRFLPNREESFLVVKDSSRKSPRAFENRYPFFPLLPEIYGQGREREINEDIVSILVQVRATSKGFFLGSGVVPGSILVTVNGIPDHTISVDYKTGEVTLRRIIFPDDTIEILYHVETAHSEGGVLFVAHGSNFHITPRFNIEVGNTLNWGLSASSESLPPSLREGQWRLRAETTYFSENLQGSLGGLFSLASPNTQGRISLIDTLGEGLSFSFHEILLTPALPDALTHGLYRKMVRKDYKDHSFGREILHDYLWSKAKEMSSKEGLSLAAPLRTDPFSERVLVMPYTLSTNEWSGGSIFLDHKGVKDLSGFTSLGFMVKKLAGKGSPIKITLQIGETGETEDGQDDGIINPRDPFLSLEKSFSLAGLSDNMWVSHEWIFSPEEKRRLTQARLLTILIETDPRGAGAASGTLLIAGARMRGSSFRGGIGEHTNLSSSGSVSFSKIPDEDLLIQHASLSEGSLVGEKVPHALRIRWKDVPQAESWWGESSFDRFPLLGYRFLTFSLKTDSLSSSNTPFTIAFIDGRGMGVHFKGMMNMLSSQWTKVRIDLKKREALLEDGSSFGRVTIDHTASYVDRLRITATPKRNHGALYISEGYATDPLLSLRGGFVSEGEYRHPTPFWKTKEGFVLGEKLSLKAAAAFHADNVLSPSHNVKQVSSSLSLTSTLLLTRWKIHTSSFWTSRLGTLFEGRHHFKFPVNFSWGWISDVYSHTYAPQKETMARETSLVLKIPAWGGLVLTSDTSAKGERIKQGWTLETGWSFPGRGTLKANMTLHGTSLTSYRHVGDYFSSWIKDFRYLAPVENGARTREWKTELSTRWGSRPVGASLSSSFYFHGRKGSQWEQKNGGSLILSLPIEVLLGKQTWRLVPTYTRRFFHRFYPTLHGSFRNGFAAFYNGLSHQYPLRDFYLFEEFFSQRTFRSFKRSATPFFASFYTAELSLLISREMKTTPFDLIIPRYFEGTYTREFHKKSDSVYHQSRWHLKFKQSAINLFGDYGVRPLFSFYESEEISNFFQFIFRGKNTLLPPLYLFSWETRLSFVGSADRSIALSNRWQRDAEKKTDQESLSITFRWRSPLKKKPIHLPFFPHIVLTKFWRFTHEEILLWEGLFPYDAQDRKDMVSTVVATHKTKIILGETGVLSGWFSVGLSNGDDFISSGFELGVELELKF